MIKLLPNRISEVMSDAQLAEFERGIRIALNALPKKPVISNEDYAKIPKKGKIRAKEADLLIRVVRKYPKFLPPSLKVADVEKDNQLSNQLLELKSQSLQELLDSMDFLGGVSGGEELNAYSRFTINVRTAAQDGDSEAIQALNEIQNVERSIGGSKTRSKKNPPTA
jgi:hypothetical protein